MKSSWLCRIIGGKLFSLISMCRLLGFEFDIQSQTLFHNWISLSKSKVKLAGVFGLSFRNNLPKRNKKLFHLPNFLMPAALERYFYRKKKKKKKTYKHRFKKKQQLPLLKFPSHVTWFFNPPWCLDPGFPVRTKANCFQESPSLFANYTRLAH